MGRLALNVYLLKSDVIDPLEVANIRGLRGRMIVPLGGEDGEAKLYYGSTNNVPDWFTSLDAVSLDRSQRLNIKAASGLLFAFLDDRWFGLTFGHGWQRIEPHAIEANFGIRCTLNLGAKNSLRAIRRDRITDDFIQAIEQIPDSDGIARFGMDVDRDLLRGVKSRVSEDDEFGDFGKNVTGGDAFKAEVDLDSEGIGSFIRRCFRLYGSVRYQQKFAWVDRVVPVRDDDTIVRLDLRLVRAIRYGVAGLNLCVPELLSWDDFDIFSFEAAKRGQAPVSTPLEVSQWKAIASANGRQVAVSDLYDKYVYAYKSGEAGVRGRWPVHACLHGMVKFKRRLFLVHGGKWFEVSKDFVEQINRKISQVPVSAFDLPRIGNGVTEGDYNRATADDSPETLLLMDKNNVMIGGGQSRIEVCDLLSIDGRMICVKPWGGSSGSLSHLFQQAMVATELVARSDEFRIAARRVLTPLFEQAWDLVCANDQETEVVLAVLRGPPKESLPFFAKVAMVRAMEALRAMRFKGTYLAVGQL